jgi:hypothetical protein
VRFCWVREAAVAVEHLRQPALPHPVAVAVAAAAVLSLIYRQHR